MACETWKIRARVMTQRRERSHGRDSKMRGFQSQKASMPVSAPHLPFPSVPADGSLGYTLVWGELEKKLEYEEIY